MNKLNIYESAILNTFNYKDIISIINYLNTKDKSLVYQGYKNAEELLDRLIKFKEPLLLNYDKFLHKITCERLQTTFPLWENYTIGVYFLPKDLFVNYILNTNDRIQW